MVCPNCHSKRLTSIQGQSYCMNCGQLVPKTAAKSVPQAITGPRRRLSDIKPPGAKPAAIRPPDRPAQAATSAPRPIPPRPVATKPEPPATTLNLWRLIRHRSVYRYGMLSGLVFAVPAALATAWVLSPLAASIGGQQVLAGYKWLAIAVAGFGAYKIAALAVRYWAGGAIIYAANHEGDSTHEQASSAGLGASWRLFALDIITGIGVAVLASGAIFFASALGLALASLLSLLAAWLAIGLLVLRGMARNQIVTAKSGLWRAVIDGAKAYLSHFAGITSRLWPAVALNGLYWTVLVGLGWLIGFGTGDLPKDWAVAASAGLLVAVIVMHLSAWVFKFNNVYFLSLYLRFGRLAGAKTAKSLPPIWTKLAWATAMIVGASIGYWLAYVYQPWLTGWLS